MAGDSERRFEKIMQKLSQSSSPKQKKPSMSSDGIGTKRSESGLRVSTSSIGSVPSCRPWDRGDLMRRLATFKAMIWFAKPKVVNAVNCARRGWINVEMDVISCEACGARILFSTPSSWSLQQVEKAAAVFSLKLDNGHKILCPWIDNACDEALAFFPPMLPPALVDGFKERSVQLLRLTALPVISSSAIYYMRSPQLEQFLSQSCYPPLTLGYGIRLTDNSRSKDLLGASDNDTAPLYFQALKIISLCGWEPRLLPYAVETEEQPSKSSGAILGEQKDSPIILTSSTGKVEGVNNNLNSLSDHQYNPASVVLDCRLCGARVGLWAFTTVQRPLEIFTLVADPDHQSESATSEGSKESSSKDYENISSTSKERHSGLNLTIAGGPPPTKQSFRPVVSFPLISRHLRAELASSSGVTDYLSSKSFSVHHENSQLHTENEVQLHQEKDTNGGSVSSEGAGSLKRKRNESESCVSARDDVISGSEIGEENSAGSSEINTLDSEDIIHKLTGDSKRRVTNSQRDEENVLHVETMIHNSAEPGENICTTSNTGPVIRDECENSSHKDTFPRVDSSTPGETSKCNHDDPSNVSSISATNASISVNDSTETDKGDRSFKDLENAKANQDHQIKALVIREGEATHGPADNLKPPEHKVTEFDPIRQHRPFCPWIAPEDGERLPGWRLTLAALTQQEKDKDSPNNSLKPDSSSTSVDEGEDPIVYIRKLFSPPPTKRLKGVR